MATKKTVKVEKTKKAKVVKVTPESLFEAGAHFRQWKN